MRFSPTLLPVFSELGAGADRALASPPYLQGIPSAHGATFFPHLPSRDQESWPVWCGPWVSGFLCWVGISLLLLPWPWGPEPWGELRACPPCTLGVLFKALVWGQGGAFSAQATWGP